MKDMLVLLLALFLWVPSMRADNKAEGVKKVGNPAPAGAPVKEIEVSAKKYEFTPAEIEVPVNTLVRLHLKSTDKEHGFELKSIKDSCVKFKPEAPATLEFYADKAGELEFSCCKFCGMGHGKMKGKLVVK
jgi:cytochrome c oxidase subunit 2